MGVLAAGLQLSAACLDERAGPNQDGVLPDQTTQVQSGSDDFEVIQRFSIDIDLAGSYRPGEPIQIIAKVQGNLATELARIAIALPELAAAQFRGQIPNGTRLPTVLSVDRGIGKGAVIVEKTTIRIPEPGYYRIAVFANPIRSAPVERGLNVQDAAFEEIWVYIDDVRGRATQRMDRSVFQPNEYEIPGPRRVRKESITPAQGTPPKDLQMLSASMALCTWRIRYIDNVNANWPVQDAEVQVSGSRSFVLRTDANGAFNLCPAPGETFSFTANFRNADLFMVANPAAQVTGITSNTVATDLIAPSLDARAYENLVRTVAETKALFVYSRSRLTAQVWNQSGSKYIDDKVFINIGDVWGPWGIFTAAHEYGHAYHMKGLGGVNLGTCPSPHYIDQATNNVQCAWSEGFADFFGVATRRAALGSNTITDYFIEIDAYFPGRNYSTGATSRDGAIIEGAVAAFLYDLVDDGSWPDGSNNEVNGDDDPMAYGGKYLADVMRTCANQVPIVTFPTTSWRWDPEYHIGMLARCLENRVSPPLPQPTLNLGTVRDQREGATEPPGWSPDNIRASWTWNLMNKT